jgi:ethanolaminephosphotransferase
MFVVFLVQITLTGFMFLLTSAFLGFVSTNTFYPCKPYSSMFVDPLFTLLLFPFFLQLYSPHLDTAPPRWVHLAHGLLLFLYQV